MRRVLYWKRLLLVVTAFVLVSGAVLAVHRFQVKTQSSIYKKRAEEVAALAEADPTRLGEAIALYREYLKFTPGDEGAYQKYANLHLANAKFDPGTTERAAAGAEDFLRLFPNHPKERQKLIELYLTTGQAQKFRTAKQHIDMLLTAPPGTSVEVLELAAECAYGLDPNNPEEALRYLDRAIATDAAPVRTYIRAMGLHLGHKKDRERKNKIDALLSALRAGRFERSLEARVAAARFEMVLNNLGPARTDLDFAVGQLGGGDDPDALLALAEWELAGAKSAAEFAARSARAEAHLQKAFARDPRNVPVGLKLAEVLAMLGKRDDGVAVLKRTAAALAVVNDQYFQLIDRLIDLGDQEFSAQLVGAKLPAGAALALYYRGRLAVLRQDWAAALKLLGEAEGKLTLVPMYHKKAMVGLAACYSAMQNPDKQLDCCRAALRDDGGYAPAIVGEAEALVRMGRNDEALQRYRAIVNLYQMSAYRTELVRLELLAALTQPAETRDWARFDEALGPPAGRAAEVHVFHADALAARGAAPEAVALLRKWLADNPKDPKAGAVWVALARVTDGGRPESAWPVLEEAQKQVGNTVEVRLARAGLLVARAKPPAPAEFDALAAGADKLSAPEQWRLYFGLGQAAARVADRGPDGEPARAGRAAAIRYLRAAADRAPKDLACRGVLLDQALAAGDIELVKRTIGEMAAVEGENGPVGALAQIAIRLPDVKASGDAAARAAGARSLRELAERVRALRPGWSRVYVALAQLDELEGLTDAALANYVQALDKGERQEAVIRRAVELHRGKQQDLQAVALLDKLSNDTRLPDDLERYRAIHRMLSAEVPKDARRTIDRIAPFDGHRDHRLMMLRGALLDAIRDDAEALKAYYRAVEWRDKDPETWASLVAQLVKHGKRDEAQRAVSEAEAKLAPAPTATPEERAELRLAVGGLYELIGDTKGALGHYTAARGAAPQELSPFRHLVLFYQRTGDFATADALLTGAKDAAAANIARWARRHLAITLTAHPDAYNRRAEALALVERNLAAAPSDSEDLKARARVWLVDPATRDEGAKVLREYARRSDLTADEFYLLGQVAFDQGKYAEAAQHFALAARPRPGVAPRHMAGLVRAYLALAQYQPAGGERSLKLAEDAVERLKAAFPGSWEATREEARLLSLRGKDRAAQADFDGAKKLLDDARAVVQKFPGWDAGTNLAARTGPLFEEMGLTADAEEAYTKFLRTSKEPHAHAPLAIHLIRQKQTERAIKLAREHEKTAPPLLTARLLTGAVRAKRPDPVDEAEIERWLDAALRAAAGKPDLEAALIGSRAELLDAQRKYPEAIAEYKRALARGKSDLVVNNLCMLIALHTPAQADEAVRMMSELIAIRGPEPSYLDTRAVAYLVSSRPAEATKDLQMALVQRERPAYRFHLAWALDLEPAKDRRIFPDEQLSRARQLGLTASDLHPIEYQKYLALMAKYRIAVDEK